MISKLGINCWPDLGKKSIILVFLAILVLCCSLPVEAGYVKKGVHKAGRGVKKGASVTVGGVKKGWRVTTGGVKKGARSTGRFFRKVF